VRKQLKSLIRRLSGFVVLQYGDGAYALVRNPADALFIERAQLQQTLERFDIDLVLDVGANVGQFGTRLRKFYDGDIVSFEPTAGAYQKLLAASVNDSRWRPVNCAVGGENATMPMNVSSTTTMSSLLPMQEEMPEALGSWSAHTVETVTVRRLGDVVPEVVGDLHGRRIYLKMDTQGYDLEAFRGLGDVRRYVCAMQSEVALIPLYEGMPHWTEAIAVYEQAGFGVAGMFPVNRVKGRVLEYDCHLLRVDEAARESR
jgi:FkbM family methyltransferase